jgi:hypothetical protein
MTRFTDEATTTALSLEFAVKLARANASDRFLLYRNNALIKEIAPPSPAPGGWAGAWTDTVPREQVHQQHYHVCFRGFSPPANVCSDGTVHLVKVEPIPQTTLKPSRGPSPAARVLKEQLAQPGGSSSPAPHPATCKAGFVWRVARPDDLVCVTPASRARVAEENRTAAERVQPGGGAYGPNTCRSGFVWREAFNGDGICVTPDIRTLVREENRLGPSRRVQP